MKREAVRITIGVTAAVVAVALLVALPPRGPRSMKQFNAARLAALELRMWQAYYGKERVRLFALLVTMLHEQYHYSWATATAEGFHLARAAATFGDLRSNYDAVLPDLEAAYGRAKEWLNAGFDPRAVARAELAWWVARRIPGQDGTDQVGDLIADEYALLYETPRERVVTSAHLRAEAAALRDAEAAEPDWDTIGRLLRQSYEELLQAFSQASASRAPPEGLRTGV
jgi:hypothetical protein